MNTQATVESAILSYARAVPQTPPGNSALKVAAVFAAIPLIVGVSCLLGWLVTSWSGFEVF